VSHNLIIYTIETGFIYGLVALGVYLTMRVIDFPDLTVNGSFTIGAAVTSSMIISGSNCYLATLCSIVAGSLAGLLTAFLNLKCKIQNLLSSIIVMIGLHSINLRIMEKPNIVFLDNITIYSQDSSLFVTIIIVAVSSIALSYFLNSEIGLGIRVTGRNPLMASAYGVNNNNSIYIALAVSNGLAALSGAMLSQLQGFADISMGNGIIVIGLASVIVGERLANSSKIGLLVFSFLAGSIIYNILIAISLEVAGTILRPSDIYIITAVLIVFIMTMQKQRVIK
jgi:putative ABC transport system permease protein